jgi:hypothetical protein
VLRRPPIRRSRPHLPGERGLLTDAGPPPHARRFCSRTCLRARASSTAACSPPASRARAPGLPDEGEADFFPAGELYLLTHGRLERQRFVPALALPPWKRVYGFRTDARALPALREIVGNDRPILRVELALETHYHGDTALCAFGPGRRFVLAWRPALAAGGYDALLSRFGNALLELSDDDARRYAANSFTYNPSGSRESFLVLPEGVSPRLLAQLRDLGVTPLTVDVSEFLKKGGGSVKCMIGDLGPVEETPSA